MSQLDRKKQEILERAAAARRKLKIEPLQSPWMGEGLEYYRKIVDEHNAGATTLDELRSRALGSPYEDPTAYYTNPYMQTLSTAKTFPAPKRSSSVPGLVHRLGETQELHEARNRRDAAGSQMDADWHKLTRAYNNIEESSNINFAECLQAVYETRNTYQDAARDYEALKAK